MRNRHRDLSTLIPLEPTASTLRTVKKLLFIVLMALLPLQMTWAAISAYCTHHEEGKAALHLGHHEDTAVIDDDSGQPDSQKAAEQSHGHHHHGGILGIVSFVSIATHDASSAATHAALQARISSPPPSQPERPNWPAAA